MMKLKYKLAVFTLLLLAFSCRAQSNINVEPAAVKNDIHQSHIGKILFTNRRIAYDKLGNDSFLTTYTLTNKSDLFFVAYFDKTLTQQQIRLLPQVATDSFFRMGNYQFTLFIDGQLIYRSNLMPGAPSFKNQSTDTYLNRPFIDNINGQGSWSESFWNRFMNNGGDKALTDGNHVLRMEIRPYVKRDTILSGALMAAGELKFIVARHPGIDITSIVLNKPTPYNGLAVSHAAFDKNRMRLLKGMIEEGIFKKVNSIVVLKKGKILVEEYFNGESRNSLHDPRSVGKSFASTLTGIAIADGYLKSDTQMISDFYDLHAFRNFTPSKNQATLRELLTMSSGFDGNDEDDLSAGNEENMYPTGDWVRFTLDLPYQPGFKEKWHYFTAGVILLGDIINTSVPEKLEKYADKKLFAPLGIVNYKWQYTPQHIPNTAGGTQMTALDFAKYGQLYKNGGTWNQVRILPKEWVKKTLARQKQITGRDNEFYGYLFWNKTFNAGNRKLEAFYCAGNGGNYILIFKDQPLVIVITASAYGQPYAHSQVAEMLSHYILPAVVQ